MALELLARSEILLSRDPYNIAKSTVRVTLQPNDTERWAPLSQFPLSVVSLNGIRIFSLKYRKKCHIIISVCFALGK